MLSSATLPKGRRGADRKGLPSRIGSLYLAALLFVMTACVELFHTCTPQWLFNLDPLNPSVSGSGCFTDRREVQAASPCLACLLLHALNATKLAILTFALTWLIFLHNFMARQRPSFKADKTGPWLIRAPPWGVAAS